MHESPEALRHTIAATQEDLHRNLEALEAKGKDLTDWRAHVDKRPLAMLGVAFVGGLLVSGVVGGRRSLRGSSGTPSSERSRAPTAARGESNELWDRFRSGIGVAAATVAIDVISKALPGIKEHVIDPVRASLRPEDAPGSGDRRFNRGRLQGTIFPKG